MYVLCKSSSSYYWTWLRPKHRVFNQNLGPDRAKIFLVCFIMFTTKQKTLLWSQHDQDPYFNMVTTRPNTSSWSHQDQLHHYGLNRTNYIIMVSTGPTTSSWSQQDHRTLLWSWQDQTPHYGPNRTEKCKHVIELWNRDQMVTMRPKHPDSLASLLVLWFMAWQRYVLLLALLCFQKFHQWAPFLLLVKSTSQQFVAVQSFFLGAPFLLLLAYFVLWDQFIASLTGATFWVRFASLVFPIYNCFTFVLCHCGC